MKFNIDKRWITVAKWLFFGTLIVFAMYHLSKEFDFNKFWKNLRDYSPWTLFFFVLLHYVSRAIYSLRMHMMCIYGLGFRGIQPWFLLRINLLGEFMEVAFPTVLGGDAVRTIKLGDETKRYGLSAAGVLVDRGMGAFVSFLIGAILFPNLAGTIAEEFEVPWQLLLTITGIVSLVLIVIIMILVKKKMHEPFLKAIRTFKWNANSVLHPFLLAVAGNMIFAASYIPLYADIGVLDKMDGWAVMALIFFGQMVMIIPISGGGFSLQEGVLVAIPPLFGISPESALTVMVISVLTRYVLAATGLGVELVNDGKRIFSSLKSGEMAQNMKKAESAMEDVEEGVDEQAESKPDDSDDMEKE